MCVLFNIQKYETNIYRIKILKIINRNFFLNVFVTTFGVKIIFRDNNNNKNLDFENKWILLKRKISEDWDYINKATFYLFILGILDFNF